MPCALTLSAALFNCAWLHVLPSKPSGDIVECQLFRPILCLQFIVLAVVTDQEERAVRH